MLSREDKDEMKEIFKPLGDAVSSQAKSIEKMTEHQGKISERIARVEENLSATKETLERQIPRCREVHKDLYDKVNPLPEKIASAEKEAEEANERSKWLRYILVGILISSLIAIFGYWISQ